MLQNGQIENFSASYEVPPGRVKELYINYQLLCIDYYLFIK